jgi:hypothetical protein
MARPKPNIILQDIDSEGRGIEVSSADAIYAVCYQDKPISVRSHINIEIGYPGPKYIKSSFSHPGHAFNLAEKLNARFNTIDFSVKLMNQGRVVKES